jgi:dipeptidyl aminopeptidase/acylaminoacyl peptidase
MKAEVMRWGDKGLTPAAKYNAVFGYQWVSPNRVVAFTGLGWAGSNRDFSHFKFLTGWARRDEDNERAGIATAADFYPLGIVPDSRQDPTCVLVTNLPDISNPEVRPDVFQMNTLDGSFHVLEKNPGDVRSWGADWDGNIRFGLMDDGVNSQLIYRPAPGEPWSAPIDFGRGTLSSEIAGLDADNRTLYVFKASPAGRKALYALDLRERKFSGPLFQHEKYDVSSAIFSPKHRRLLGVRYVTEGPRQYWFEADFAKLQQELEAANPGVATVIVNMDWDLRKILAFSYSAKESGYYTLLNLDTGKLLPIAKTRPWLKPEDMAEMHPVKCAARDGLELNGYLTMPVGRGRKNLPLVTFVHGGPFDVRDEWGFDPIVQFLANRGYAVLQVNYRGSGGFGDEFYKKGQHEVGGAIENDIVDMTQWAVQQGLADPHRLAVMGYSYGGYSTLFALAHTPELFRCGIACGAVSDWIGLQKSLEEDYLYANDALRFWAVMLGDMQNEKGRERLAAVSPVNLAAQIKAPLLIFHGEIDSRVPIEQAHKMVAALKKAGHPPETLYLERIGHWWPTGKKGEEFLKRLETFLATNLGDPARGAGPASAPRP